MKTHQVMALLCVGLFLGTVLSTQVSEPKTFSSWIGWALWNGFLFGVPVILGAILLTGKRWAFMVGVMYGTIGLALDISTVVQRVIQTPIPGDMVSVSVVTGVMNFLLIVFGGRGFLKMH